MLNYGWYAEDVLSSLFLIDALTFLKCYSSAYLLSLYKKLIMNNLLIAAQALCTVFNQYAPEFNEPSKLIIYDSCVSMVSSCMKNQKDISFNYKINYCYLMYSMAVAKVNNEERKRHGRD